MGTQELQSLSRLQVIADEATDSSNSSDDAIFGPSERFDCGNTGHLRDYRRSWALRTGNALVAFQLSHARQASRIRHPSRIGSP